MLHRLRYLTVSKPGRKGRREKCGCNRRLELVLAVFVLGWLFFLCVVVTPWVSKEQLWQWRVRKHRQRQTPLDVALHPPPILTIQSTSSAEQQELPKASQARQGQSSSPRKVLVFKENFSEVSKRANEGKTPGGELCMFRSLLKALAWLEEEVQYRVVETNEELEKLVKVTPLSAFDAIFYEQYGLDALRKFNATSDPRVRCRLRAIDFWGTPPEQNHFKLNLKQFLVPYPNQWNSFLGFLVPSITPRRRQVRNESVVASVLLHGKYAKYFVDHLPMIGKLAKRFTVYSTLPDHERKLVGLPSAVRNVGMLTKDKFMELLQQVDIVLGLGDPVLAPTALETVSAGSIYVFPVYSRPRKLSDIPNHPIRSQHDFLLQLQTPCAYGMEAMLSYRNVVSAIKKAMQVPCAAFIPPGFSREDFTRRVKQLLLANFCGAQV